MGHHPKAKLGIWIIDDNCTYSLFFERRNVGFVCDFSSFHDEQAKTQSWKKQCRIGSFVRMNVKYNHPKFPENWYKNGKKLLLTFGDFYNFYSRFIDLGKIFEIMCLRGILFQWARLPDNHFLRAECDKAPPLVMIQRCCIPATTCRMLIAASSVKSSKKASDLWQDQGKWQSGHASQNQGLAQRKKGLQTTSSRQVIHVVSIIWALKFL